MGSGREGGKGMREVSIKQIQVDLIKRSVARLYKGWTGCWRERVQRKRNRKVIADGDRVINTDGVTMGKKGRGHHGKVKDIARFVGGGIGEGTKSNL